MRSQIFLSYLLVLLVSSTELFLFANGHYELFAQIPGFPGHQFYDLYIWSANLSDCKIPVSELFNTNHCGIQYYIFGQPWFPLFFFRLLGLTSKWHHLYGLLIGMYAMTALVLSTYLTHIRFLKQYQDQAKRLFALPLILLAIFLSFPFRYALERGQTDLFMLGTLCLVACLKDSFLIRKWSRRLYSLSLTALLAVTILAKIYTMTLVPLFVVWAYILFLPKRSSVTNDLLPKKRDRIFFVSLALILIICVAMVIPIYSFISDAAFDNLGNSGFGLHVLLNAPYTSSFTLGLSSKLAIFFLGCFLSFNRISFKTTQIKPFIEKTTISWHRLSGLETLSVMMAIVLPPIYIATESFPYKYILLCAAIPGLLLSTFRCLPNSYRVQVNTYLILLMIISMYLPYLPYSPSLSLYLEWYVHFFLHPFLMGYLFACPMSILCASGKPYQITTNQTCTDSE